MNKWIQAVLYSRLEPLKEVARMLRNHQKLDPKLVQGQKENF